ncbi:hypothetical protein BC939DRAFT_182693 [Gamsiella multidivaricata]|uniref:uncharacterized protein n=1 Tax=Gamsiella multidivaricata TaxID=101098 RepID=UPI0022202634|nr:uncharacterized protein BC939DRAFT_182693 [Gamsiella multidivaricata]KAI7822366.1 hypothetical protein BC939DRAFT_182693 [Gamsiella multidivaricata]
MLELWKDICSEKDRIYRRVLSGPMGVGKSYLSYFLAARAYAEGWPTLYISDAGKLDTNTQEESTIEVVKRFLAINKDILTAAELEKLVGNYNGGNDISNGATSVIFDDLLQQRGRKALLIVDDHWKLFEKVSDLPTKFRSLNPLSSYHWWGEDSPWSRVIFTGTAHAKYEMTVMDDSYRPTSVLFVGPLSDTVFPKLLDTYPRLNLPDIKDEVKAITNCVPRELMRLSAFLKYFQDPISTGDLQKFTKVDQRFF